MRKLLTTSAAAIVLSTLSAQAAPMLEVKLVPVQVGDPASLIFDIQIQARVTDTLTGNGGGGLGGMQVDILSDGTDQIAPVPAALSGPNSGKVKTTFNVTGFSTILPLKMDATTALGYPLDSDTDLDGLGLSIGDPNNFTNTTVGVGDWTLIATEQWQLASPTSSDTLRAHIVGPVWYDFVNGQAPSFRAQFATIDTSGVANVAVPEPASLGLLTLASVGLIARRRRAC